VAQLVNQIGDRVKKQLQEVSQLPENATYTFDQEPRSSKVLKTTVRKKVISMDYGKFQAKEEVRCFPKDTTLSIIVPRGANYGYDIISAVGLGSFIAGKKLSAIKEELELSLPHLSFPYSSLYDQQRKFLFYFGELHRAAIPLIREYLHSFGKLIWLVDGTLEPGSDVFFGVQEGQHHIMLDCFKIATENEPEITKCLQTVGAAFGRPDEIIHDLSRAIQTACENSYGDVVQRVCHFHFTRDVGSDLYAVPDEMLSQQLKKIKLKLHLKEQRKSQGQWLRNRIAARDNLILEKLLNGIEVPTIDNELVGRELFLSLNHWLLDYAHDGQRQGFPFDPYLLYFHRRSLRVYEAINRILTLSSSVPQCLIFLAKKLESYLTDCQIIKASSLYEKAFSIFNDIRASLRLLDAANNPSPIYETYDISPLEQKEIFNNLLDLKSRLQQQMQSSTEVAEKKLYDIASKHIEKYEPYLINESNIDNHTEKIIRTTNKLEQHWGKTKRIKRQITGRKRLTRELNSLPKEFMLVQNLDNPFYVELVVGDIEQLPAKLSEVGKLAGPYSCWKKNQNVNNVSKISKNILRKNSFIEDIVEISHDLFDMN